MFLSPISILLGNERVKGNFYIKQLLSNPLCKNIGRAGKDIGQGVSRVFHFSVAQYFA